jgi:hypothetical protein
MVNAMPSPSSYCCACNLLDLKRSDPTRQVTDRTLTRDGKAHNNQQDTHKKASHYRHDDLESCRRSFTGIERNISDFPLQDAHAEQLLRKQVSTAHQKTANIIEQTGLNASACE